MALAALAAAPSHESRPRDLATIQTALEGINTALAQLDTSILSGKVDFSLIQASMSVLQSIQSATGQVQASQPLDVADTSNLKATTDSLTSYVNVTVSDLIKDQAVFQRVGATQQVLQTLQTTKMAAVQLANVLAGRVPSDLSSIADQGVNNLVDALDRGVAVYNGTTKDLGAALPPAAAPPAPSAVVSSAAVQSFASPVPAMTGGTSSATAPLAVSGIQASGSVLTPAPQSFMTIPGTPPVAQASQATAVLASLAPQAPPPPLSSFGGISAPMPILGTFIPGETCMCMCPAIVEACNHIVL